MTNGKALADNRRNLSANPRTSHQMAPLSAAGGLSRLAMPRTLAFVTVSTLCLALAGCGSAPKSGGKVKFSEEKYGVAASPRMVDGGKPVPKGGGRYMVGKPYKVAGKWYRPKLDPNYKSEGLASWYGPTFHGRMTANGEIFDRNALTAAHTTMPLPSYAKVTNVKNGRSMIVRVNDRGPFHGNRTIDLSERVATMLDYKSKGVAKVRVEYIGRAPLHGQDEAFLLASYNGPGSVEPGATMPGTMLAMADPQSSVPVAIGPAPVPRNRPYGPVLAGSGDFGRMVTAAFDPATAFEAGAATMRVASLNTFSVPGSDASAEPVLGYDENGTKPGKGPLSLTGERETAPGPAYLGQPSTFARGSAVSSYHATARIEAAYSAFDAISGGVAPRDLVRAPR